MKRVFLPMKIQQENRIAYIKRALNEVADIDQLAEVELAVDEALEKVEVLERILKERT